MRVFRTVVATTTAFMTSASAWAQVNHLPSGGPKGFTSQDPDFFGWKDSNPQPSKPVKALAWMEKMGEEVFTKKSLPQQFWFQNPVGNFAQNPITLVNGSLRSEGLVKTGWHVDLSEPENPKALSLVFDTENNQAYMIFAEVYGEFRHINTFRISQDALFKLSVGFPDQCTLTSLCEINCNPHSIWSYLQIVPEIIDPVTGCNGDSFSAEALDAARTLMPGADDVLKNANPGRDMNEPTMVEALATLIGEGANALNCAPSSLRGAASGIHENIKEGYCVLEWPNLLSLPIGSDVAQTRPWRVTVDVQGQWTDMSWSWGDGKYLTRSRKADGTYTQPAVRMINGPKLTPEQQRAALREAQDPANCLLLGL